MNPEISERSFEDAIECALLAFGPDACPGESVVSRETRPSYGRTLPGEYRKRRPEENDKSQA